MRYTKKTGISEVISRLRREEGYNEEKMIKHKGVKTKVEQERMLIQEELNPPAETKLT